MDHLPFACNTVTNPRRIEIIYKASHLYCSLVVTLHSYTLFSCSKGVEHMPNQITTVILLAMVNGWDKRIVNPPKGPYTKQIEVLPPFWSNTY